MKIWKRLFGKRNQGDLKTMPGQPATTPPNSAALSTAKPGSQSSVTRDRVIRVFISSTFHDMQDERDILIKKIFPQLRKLCEERAVTWTEVDLRWGITTEESAEGKVLPLCLVEIQRCRPYFIGLLGERYGWVPDSIPADLLESQLWLNEHLEHSVTELEILHGVFSEEQMHGQAYFYFRDPKYLESVPDGKRQDFISRISSQRVMKHQRNLLSSNKRSRLHTMKRYVNCAKTMQIQNSSVSGYWKISQHSLTVSIRKTRYLTHLTRKLCATRHTHRAEGSLSWDEATFSGRWTSMWALLP